MRGGWWRPFRTGCCGAPTSRNAKATREEYKADPEAYYAKFGRNEQQKEACRKANVLDLIAAGGDIYDLAKFAGIFNLDVLDVGAQQTGMTKEEFKEKLRRAGD